MFKYVQTFPRGWQPPHSISIASLCFLHSHIGALFCHSAARLTGQTHCLLQLVLPVLRSCLYTRPVRLGLATALFNWTQAAFSFFFFYLIGSIPEKFSSDIEKCITFGFRLISRMRTRMLKPKMKISVTFWGLQEPSFHNVAIGPVQITPPLTKQLHTHFFNDEYAYRCLGASFHRHLPSAVTLHVIRHR